MIRRVTDFVWPTLERPSAAARSAADASLSADLQAIDACSFAQHPAEAFQEAKRLASDETERRRGAEARASAYLLVIAALIPLLTYLEGTVWGHSFGQAPPWASLSILAVAVLYLLGAGRWAFWTLRVGSYARVDGNDIVAAWQTGGPNVQELLTKKLLSATRRNRAGVNDKISGIIMAHIFLSRSILWFGMLLLVQIVWYFSPPIVDWSKDTVRNLVCQSNLRAGDKGAPDKPGADPEGTQRQGALKH